jgi:hypothetical protein
MNEHDSSIEALLQALPSPRSPRNLDLEILRYARDQAQERSRRRPSRWVAGVVFASAAGLALFIAMPSQPPTTRPHEDNRQINVLKPSQRSVLPPGAPGAGSDGKTAAPVPATRLHREPGEAAGSATARPAQKQNAAPAALSGSRDFPQEDDAPVISLEAEQAVSGPPGRAVGEALRNMAAMLDRGEQEEARDAYQALLRDCPGCALPATLEQALADLPRP